jgi:hypothetical protein
VLGFAGPVAIGFDDAYVFALEAGADGCPHSPQEHARAGSESDGIVPLPELSEVLSDADDHIDW